MCPLLSLKWPAWPGLRLKSFLASSLVGDILGGFMLVGHISVKK